MRPLRSGNGRHRRPRQAPALLVTAGVTGASIAIPLLGATGAHAADVSTWDRVAECESGGLWSSIDADGFYGGLQLTLDTWKKYGGTQYAERPDLASRLEQIAVAEKVLKAEGPQAWPRCAIDSGLNDDPSQPPSGQGDGQGDDQGQDQGQDHGSGDNSPSTPAPSPSTSSPAPSPSTSSPSTPPPTSDPGTETPSGPGSGVGSDGGDGADPGTGTGGNGDDGSATPAPSPSGHGNGGASSHGSHSTPGGGKHHGGHHAGHHGGHSSHDGDGRGGHTSRDHGRDGGHEGEHTHRHKVTPGESLWAIAGEHHVHGGWRALYEHNRELVGEDPGLIHPGQELTF